MTNPSDAAAEIAALNEALTEAEAGLLIAMKRDAALKALRAEMVGMQAAGASLVGRSWIIHKLDRILATEATP